MRNYLVLITLIGGMFLFSCSGGDSVNVEDAENSKDISLFDTTSDLSHSDISDVKDVKDIVSDTGEDVGDAGYCSKVCPNNMHCENDNCVCNDGFGDCNGDMTDGCEVDLKNDIQHCGRCDMDCSGWMLHALFKCVDGDCEVDQCMDGFENCDGRSNNGCEIDLRRDPRNCGRCNRDCGPNSVCEKGVCGCETGFADCNNTISDGCEQNISSDDNNCGGCGKTCGNKGHCSNGNCICEYGSANCNNNWGDGCETNTKDDIYHCGDCNTDCTKLGNVGSSTCINGSCFITSCKSGYRNCNDDISDGCEVNINTDYKNCGSCGNSCGNNSVCNMGQCACKSDYFNCNTLWTDGCEIDSNSTKTCGADCNSLINCGDNTICKNHICECVSPFMDCQNGWSDGCETNTSNDRFNCGACNSTCVKINYSGICKNSKCAGRYSSSRSFGSTDMDEGNAIAIDPSGNIILAGSFSGVITIGNKSFTSNGERDIFIAKFDSMGSLIDAKAFGSTGFDRVQGMAVNQNGDIIITGYYSGVINFGGVALNNFGEKDIFLVKFNNNLDHIFSRGFGSTSNDEGIAVAVDNNLNIILTGSFSNTINLGGENLSSGGCTDVFLAKFDNSGNHLWSKSYGSSVATNGCDMPTSIVIDKEDNIYLTGSFGIRINFGLEDLITKGSSDIFIANIDKTGKTMRSISLGTTGFDLGFSIKLNSSNEIVLSAGIYGNLTLNGKEHISKGQMDILLVKYDSGLNIIDSQSFGSIYNDAATITLDSEDNIILTGSSSGIIKFGDEQLTNYGAEDIILVKLDKNFNHIFSYTFGSTGSDMGQAVVTDKSGNIYLTGSISGDVDFGGGNVSFYGIQDIFLSKFLP